MKKNKEIIWEDSGRKERSFDSYLFLFFFVLFIVLFVVMFKGPGSYVSLVFSILFLFLFILMIRLKHITMESKGLWSGNNTSGQFLDKLLMLKQKNIFITWSKIREIKIVGKVFAVSYGGDTKDFAVLETKSREEYECLIIDIKGFIQALKKLGKYNLLSKETKEKYK